MRMNGDIEFRLFYTEKLVDWMLHHGTFDKQLTEEDLQAIEDEALKEVQVTINYSFNVPTRAQRRKTKDS